VSRSSLKARSRSSSNGGPLANLRMSWCRTACSLRLLASRTAWPPIGRLGALAQRRVPTQWGSRGESDRSTFARRAGSSATIRRKFSRARRNAIASYRTGASGRKKRTGLSRAIALWFRRRRQTIAQRCPNQWSSHHRRSLRQRPRRARRPRRPRPQRRRRHQRLRNRCRRLRLR